MSAFIVILEATAFLFWVAAFWYAHQMYSRTFHVTTAWFFIRAGIFFLGLASLTNVLEWAGVFPEEVEALQEIFIGIGSFAWLAVVYSYYRERRLLGHLEFIEELERSPLAKEKSQQAPHQELL